MQLSDRKYDQLTPSNILRSVIEDVACRNKDANPSHYPTHYPTQVSLYPTKA
jgi:hypothetical protein